MATPEAFHPYGSFALLDASAAIWPILQPGPRLSPSLDQGPTRLAYGNQATCNIFNSSSIGRMYEPRISNSLISPGNASRAPRQSYTTILENMVVVGNRCGGFNPMLLWETAAITNEVLEILPTA
ncbi:hypothetical protein MKZ38_003847 [Zalerion maritima]|uniref:Uncharacterized protein n=1 Tax=Zalerion maritima TaxID=339359 RepID=A0AAD5WRI4_9PEZI|nr:hypothetical protein MKZ38_003847 [Zalerion maritima]